MRSELKQFPMEAGCGVDGQSGLLCPLQSAAVNFEPMQIAAGEQLFPLKPNLEYQVAMYSREPDPQYIYTYSYPPEANLTAFYSDKSVFQWKTGPCLFSEPAYVRIIVRADIQADGVTLADYFRWEGEEKSAEPLPRWIDEEAERVSTRVQQCRRPDDLVFFLLTDIH